MCERTESFNKIRVRLNDYRLLNKEIDNNIERLEMLQMKAYSPSSPTLTGMPRSQSENFDKIAYAASKISDLENEIRTLIKERDKEKEDIEILVKMLKNPDEKAVILLRYIDSAEWVDIILLLYGNKEDYEEKFDNYKQRVFRLHNSAMSNMSKI